ncbi:MAG: ribonuclease D [Gammaproteobacteria bacterium]|nr:ribonuclease D [Gammaproteobacteria bacterium]
MVVIVDGDSGLFSADFRAPERLAQLLVQVAGPNQARCIDPLSKDLDLTPLLSLMANPKVLKVFHAARQDLEIFYTMMGDVPKPLFDTQIAAMVCGFGNAVSYENLVWALEGVAIDKSMRVTDWAKRPLSPQQIDYALSDVVHLRAVYDKLIIELEKTQRLDWLDEEIKALSNLDLYRMDPTEAWTRIRVKKPTPRLLCLVRELAAWREREAQRRDVPRQRVLRDEVLLDIATRAPKTLPQLEQIRNLPKGYIGGQTALGLLEAVRAGKEAPCTDQSKSSLQKNLPKGTGRIVDLLRVLLKIRSEEHNVAPKLVANTEDLEKLALDDAADIPALTGWRRTVFGEDALALKRGELALRLAKKGRRVEVLPLTS